MLWPWNWKVYPCQFSACINANLLGMNKNNLLLHMIIHHDIFKHSWALTLVLWPFSACINTSILKIDIVTPYHIRLWNMTCLSMFQLVFRPWYCFPSQFMERSHYHIRLGRMFALKYYHQVAGNHELWPCLSHFATDMGLHMLSQPNQPIKDNLGLF